MMAETVASSFYNRRSLNSPNDDNFGHRERAQQTAILHHTQRREQWTLPSTIYAIHTLIL